MKKNCDSKDIVTEAGGLIDKDIHRTLDPKIVFIIGNRNSEFPHTSRKRDDICKSETFERFRRNCRNVDIITYDELFERAYHIVFSHKIAKNWFEDSLFDIK